MNTSGAPNDSAFAAAARRLQPARGRPVWIVVGALVVFALLQSITITPAIHGRVVDEHTREPVSGAAIAALWYLELTTIVDSPLPGGPVKLAESSSDRDGRFDFARAVLIHWPVAPFSLFVRSADDMPKLIVAKPGYQVRIARNDVFGIDGPRHGAGFLSLRSSSLERVLVLLPRWSPDPDAQANDRRTFALDQIEQAERQCSQRLLCQAQSLRRTHDVLVRAPNGSVPIRTEQ